MGELSENTTQEIPGSPEIGTPRLQTMFPDGISKPNQLTGFAPGPALEAETGASAHAAVAAAAAARRLTRPTVQQGRDGGPSSLGSAR